MTLVFHKIEHTNGKAAGATVDVLLKEGLFSVEELKKRGKLPKEISDYERAKISYRIWVEERTKALADNPVQLESLLSQETEELHISRMVSRFKMPNAEGNRTESVFFGCLENPPIDRDWVAIDVEDSTELHYASYRGENNYNAWSYNTITIADYVKNNYSNPNWPGKYCEITIPNHVPPGRIVAYAKLEKSLNLQQRTLDQSDRKLIINYLANKLSFATQFNSPNENILLNAVDECLEIRVSFNKDKASRHQSEIKLVFNNLPSIDVLLKESKEWDSTQGKERIETVKISNTGSKNVNENIIEKPFDTSHVQNEEQQTHMERPKLSQSTTPKTLWQQSINCFSFGKDQTP